MPKTILVADDSRTIQQAVTLTFRTTEFDVVTAGDADAALSRIAEVQPCVVLADTAMPGRDGYDLCSTIKADANMSGIPVLLLAGAFDPFDEQRAAEARADGHIKKPFDTQSLIDRVKEVTGERAIEDKAPMSFADSLAARQAPPAEVPAQAAPVAAQDLVAGGNGGAAAFGAPRAEPASPAMDKVAAAGPSLEPPSPPSGQDRPKVDPWALAEPPPGAPAVAARGGGAAGAGAAVPSAVADKAATAVAAVAETAIPPGLPREELVQMARQVIEEIAWEVVPDLAESIIRQELDRLLQ